MNALNGLLTAAFQWLFAPLAAWPLSGLLLYALIVGILMSLVFKYASNQTALASVLDRSRGHMLAIKLFKDDFPGIFRSLANVFWLTLQRLWYSMFPLLVMILPLFFFLSQLYLHYEYRPLTRDEQAIVQLQLNEQAWDRFQDAKIAANPQFTVETDALRDARLRSIFWRIRAGQPGLSSLSWQLGDAAIEKNLVVATESQTIRQVSSRRPGPAWWDRSWFAGEPSFATSSPVAAAVVYYPRRETPILGFRIPWWVTFFVVSILAALLVQPILKVRF